MAGSLDQRGKNMIAAAPLLHSAFLCIQLYTAVRKFLHTYILIYTMERIQPDLNLPLDLQGPEMTEFPKGGL